MGARAKLAESTALTPAKSEREAPPEGFIPSGCALLDLVLGGGWARGRVCNLVGDRSSGKTLLAVEAAVNFTRLGYPADCVKYADAESAFDSEYQRLMGFPEGVQGLDDEMRTVEDFYNDIDRFAAGQIKRKLPGLYILDSLDALSDEVEMARKIEDGATYGTAKAKKLSEMFRRKIGEWEKHDITLMVISQIRDKIGVTFGETKTRSGGKALDFYCSQIVWLAEKEKLKRTALGQTRAIGITTKARTKKNKVALPFRECEMDIIFNYGIDDEISMLKWLGSTEPGKLAVKKGLGLEVKAVEAELADARKKGEDAILGDFRDGLKEITAEHWARVEKMLEPPLRKYT